MKVSPWALGCVGFLFLLLGTVPVAAMTAWIASAPSAPPESDVRYRSPEEACFLGNIDYVIERDRPSRPATAEYRILSASVQPAGKGDYQCRGLIHVRNKPGPVGWQAITFAADSLIVGSAESCNVPNYTDPINGQCGPPKCTDECCGDCGNGTNPIHTASGNKHQTEADFIGSGPFPLRFVRTYNSNRATEKAFTFGAGWTHNYAARVIGVGPEPFTRAIAYRPDGRIFKFQKVGSAWQSDPDVAERLSLATDGTGMPEWTLTTKDDTVERYDGMGLLQSLTNRDGFTQNLIYVDSAGRNSSRVQKVIDSQGRTLTFAYNAALQLQTVIDGNSRVFTYGYTGINLTSVVYPMASGTRIRTYLYNESGQTSGANLPNVLTGIVDEAGQRFASWGYTAAGRANLSVHGPFSSGTIDRTSLTFNSGGTTTVVDGLGQSRVFGFNAQHLVARIASLDQSCDYCTGAAKAKTYDGNGYPESARDFRDTETLHTYNARGLEMQRVEANTVPSPSNPSTRITPDEKRTISTVWNANFRVPDRRSTVNRLGTTEARTDWTYNARGQSTARCDYDLTATGAGSYVCSASGTPPAAIRRWTYTYCDAVDGTNCPLIGLIRTVNGPRNDVSDVTSFAYRMNDDPANPKKYRKGDLWKTTNALGQVTEYQERDGNGRPTKVIDANGVVTQMGYHPRGWLQTRTVKGVGGINGGADAVTTISYDDVGNVARVTKPDGSYLAYSYDIAHRLTTITDNLGNSVLYTLNALGNRTAEETFASGSSTPTRLLTRSFDTLNRLRDQYNAQNDFTHFDYDGNGNRIDQIDPTTVKTHSIYDPLNRLRSVVQDYQGTDPGTANATSNYGYDARDNLRQVTDPEALATGYTVDGLSNLRTLASPDTGSTSYQYDAAGNRIQLTDARGIPNANTFDALNRLKYVQYSATSSASYFYDEGNTTTGCTQSYPVGRLTRMVDPSGSTTYCYDHRGNVIRKTQVTANATHSVGYTYSLADRLSAVDYPEGVRAEYSRDALGRITALKVRPTATGTLTNVLTNVTYRPFGPAATYTFSAGAQSLALTYDQNEWVTDVAGSVLNLHFCRNAVGDITRLKSSASACTGTATEQYGYDALNRLRDVRNGSSTLIEGYTYSPTGDRVSKTVGSTTTPYTFGASSHRLVTVGTQTRDYDAAGSMTLRDGFTETFEYDERNRYVRHTRAGFGGGTSSPYEYNARGERVWKAANNRRTEFVYDEGGRLLAEAAVELGGGGEISLAAAAPVSTSYIYADGRLVALVRNGTIYYVHSDHLGTPRAVTAAGSATPLWNWSFAGNPFGEQAPTGGVDLNLRFPGQYYDAESGLHYNYFRDYEPTTGRYIESDPIGLYGGLSTYSYAGDDPLRFVDPDGRAPYPALFCHVFPRLCGDLNDCLTHPENCRGKFCRAGNAIYHSFCDKSSCSSGDSCPVLAMKMTWAASCLTNRLLVKQVCFGGKSDPGHDQQIDFSIAKVNGCRMLLENCADCFK